MQIQNLKLKNYRNHKKLALEFTNPLTLVVGPNGSGKTNILEAINLLSTGKSQKCKYDVDLINYEQPFCTIDANIALLQDNMGVELQVIRTETSEHSSTKKSKVNKVPKSLHGFCGMFNSVMFMPEDIQLITGSPSERRRYMDGVLTQVDPKYKKVLGHYIRAVRQRNKILEMINETGRGRDQLGFWDEQVLENGKFLQQKRTYMFENIQPQVMHKGKELNSRKNEIELIYHKNEINPARLELHHDHEIAAKVTLVGPHRDDFEILFDGRNVSEFGSRGQQRSTILALKLSEIDFIEAEKGERPVLLLDDIFSELDERHQEAVLEVIANQQTIITSTENIPGVDLGNAEVIKI